MQRTALRLPRFLPSTLRTQTRTLTTTPRPLFPEGPNGEPNAAASETTGTDAKKDPEQTHEAQKEKADNEGKHPAKTGDVQEKPTRGTGIMMDH